MSCLIGSCDPVQDPDCPPELQPFLESEGETGPPVIGFGEKTPIQCLRSSEFWLLFTTSAILSGCGLTLLNNLAQMVGHTEAAWLTQLKPQDSTVHRYRWHWLLLGSESEAACVTGGSSQRSRINVSVC